MDWQAPSTRRLGFTAGTLDGLPAKFQSHPISITVSFPSDTTPTLLKRWWGGTVTRRRRLTKLRWVWHVQGDEAFRLLLAACLLMPVKGKDVLKLLRRESRERKQDKLLSGEGLLSKPEQPLP